MPNKPSIHKVVLSIRVQRTLKRRLQKVAIEKKMSLTEYVEWLLWRETQGVVLNGRDYEDIAKETSKAEAERS